jgi:hypothetical protein
MSVGGISQRWLSTLVAVCQQTPPTTQCIIPVGGISQRWRQNHRKAPAGGISQRWRQSDKTIVVFNLTPPSKTAHQGRLHHPHQPIKCAFEGDKI